MITFILGSEYLQSHIVDFDNISDKDIEHLTDQDIKDMGDSMDVFVNVNPDKILDYATVYLKKAQLLNDPTLTASAYTRIGDMLRAKSNFEGAIKYYAKAYNIFKQSSEKKGFGWLISRMGNLYYRLKNYDAALENWFEAKAIAEEINDNFMLSVIVYNIGLGYMEKREYQKAEQIIKSQIEKHKQNNLVPVFEQGDSLRVIYGNLYLSELYIHWGKPQKSNEVLDIIQEYYDIIDKDDLSNKNSYIMSKGRYYTCRALTASLQGNKTDLDININKATKIFYNDNQILELMRAYIKLMELNNKYEQYQISIDYGIKIIDLLHNESLAELENKMQIYKIIHRSYKALGNEPNSLKYLEFAFEISTQLNKEDHINELEDFDELVKVEAKLLNFENIEKENEIKEANLKAQRYFIIGLSSSLVLIIILGYILYNRYKLLSKSRFELSSINAKLQVSEADLQHALDQRNKFFSIVSHDLRSPLSGFKMITESIVSNLELYSQQEIKEILEDLKISASNLILFLNNLLEWSSIQLGRIKPFYENVNLSQLFDYIKNVNQTSLTMKKINLIIDIPKDVNVVSDLNILSIIFSNLISNAIKFSNQGSNIRVFLKYNDDNNLVKVVVQDSGVGMEKYVLEKIFDEDNRKIRKGTKGETGTGLGMILTKEFTKLIQASIEVQSELGNGTSFSISLYKVLPL